MMVNTTLQAMQEIEEAAKLVIESYEQDIRELERSKAAELADLSRLYEEESQLELARLSENYQAQLAALKEQVAITREQNQAAVSKGLVDRKEALVQAIVDKVVDKYGN